MEWWLPGEGEHGQLVFRESGVSVWKVEGLEMDRGDGVQADECTSCHRPVQLKMPKMVESMLCVFHHNFKKWHQPLREVVSVNLG